MTNLYISAPPPRNAVAPTPLYNSSGYSNIRWLNASICGYRSTFASKTCEIPFANCTAKQGAGTHAVKERPFVHAHAAEEETRHHLGAQLPASLNKEQSTVWTLRSQHISYTCLIKNIKIKHFSLRSMRCRLHVYCFTTHVFGYRKWFQHRSNI